MTVEDWQSINCFFSKHLSNQIIFENIYPYIYEPHPKYLLDDMKSFFSEYKEVEKIYKETFTAHHFWQDIYNFLQQEDPPLGWFHNGKNIPDRGGLFDDAVIRRHYSFKDKLRRDIFHFYNCLYYTCGFVLTDINNPDSKELIKICRNLFALFTPDERVDFVENWINKNATPREEYLQQREMNPDSPTIMDSLPYMTDY